MKSAADSTYNGWANYATWRINLEIFDGFEVGDLDGVDSGEVDYYYIAEQLEEYANQVIFDCGECNPQSLAGSYALAFLSDVDWIEIAKHLVDDYISENLED